MITISCVAYALNSHRLQKFEKFDSVMSHPLGGWDDLRGKRAIGEILLAKPTINEAGECMCDAADVNSI